MIGRRAVHDAALLDFDQFRGSEVTVRAVGQKWRNSHQSTLYALAAEKLLLISQSEKEPGKFPFGSPVEGVHGIIGDQIVLSLDGHNFRRDIRDIFRGNHFGFFDIIIGSFPFSRANLQMARVIPLSPSPFPLPSREVMKTLAPGGRGKGEGDLRSRLCLTWASMLLFVLKDQAASILSYGAAGPVDKGRAKLSADQFVSCRPRGHDVACSHCMPAVDQASAGD